MGRLVAGRWPRNCNHHPISALLLSSRCRETVLSVPPLRIYRSSCLSYSLRLFPLLLRVFSLPPPPLGLISFHARQEWLSPWKMGGRCRWFSLRIQMVLPCRVFSRENFKKRKASIEENFAYYLFIFFFKFVIISFIIWDW